MLMPPQAFTFKALACAPNLAIFCARSLSCALELLSTKKIMMDKNSLTIIYIYNNWT